MPDILDQNLASLKELVNSIEGNQDFKNITAKAGDSIVSALKNGRKILIAGNGGSAAEAQHFSAELIGRYKKERSALPSIALTTDTSIITAIGNDYGYDTIFDRQVAGLGNNGDILVLMSTSGKSKNLISANKIAKEKGVLTIGLLGKDGGQLKDLVDIAIVVPSDDTARIQEIHLMLIHSWCELVDSKYE